MKYLFISCHVDDAELSCGGTISKLVEEGNEVTIITLSQYYPKNLSNEWQESMKVLNPAFRWLQDFTVRNFDKQRQGISEYLYLNQDYDCVFAPSPQDLHSDHSTVGKVCVNIYKNTNLILYIANWNQREFRKNYFVKLKKGHIENKLKALDCYRSQLGRYYFNHDYIFADALVNGVMCKTQYAEGFEAFNIIA